MRSLEPKQPPMRRLPPAQSNVLEASNATPGFAIVALAHLEVPGLRTAQCAVCEWVNTVQCATFRHGGTLHNAQCSAQVLFRCQGMGACRCRSLKNPRPAQRRVRGQSRGSTFQSRLLGFWRCPAMWDKLRQIRARTTDVGPEPADMAEKKRLL